MGNEIVLVDQFVRQAQDNRQHPLSDSVAFEHFAASIVLDEQFLSDDELSAGIIGGAQDGGIDAAYTFLDDHLLDEDTELFEDNFNVRDIRKGAELRLVLVQAKRSEGFGEDAFDKVRASTEKLLDLNAASEALNRLYSADVVTRVKLFTDAWTKLSVRSPRIFIGFWYVTRGDSCNLSEGVMQKQADLKDCLIKAVPGADVNINLLGAKDLWERASASPSYDLQLRFRDYVSEGDSYIGLVSLPDYYRFLSDDSGVLRGHLFDWNVRDFQGNVSVNKQIRASLETDSDRDFWWLNNGVTILCAEANIGGDKTFTLCGVQIVNGMQTSYAIHDVLSSMGADLDQHARRSVQVRIVRTQDEKTRDEIIRATNSQTKVPDASLHATEDIHRQLESHFAQHGWYYDRRKNFYKNAGKPVDRIISIPMLGQAVMAIGLGRPDDARARPTTLLNNSADYSAIFNPKLPLDVYLWIASKQRQVDTLLLSSELANEAAVRTNCRFYVSFYIVTKAYGAQIFSPSQLISCASNNEELTSAEVQEALSVVLDELQSVSSLNGWQPDRASKSHDLVDAVLARALLGSDNASGEDVVPSS